MATKKTHHHGNLRAALIEAGIKLIDEGGADALSLRKAAAIAGVSHAAPAHHFPSLADFNTALITEGFNRFTAMMEDDIAASDGSPRGELLGCVRGYQNFAHANPGLFHLIFGGKKRDEADPDLHEAASKAFGVLLRVCAPLAQGPAGAEGNALLVWSIAHGLASLTGAGQGISLVPGSPGDRIEAIFPNLPLAPAAPDDE